jgi:hypothetical protein
MKPIDGDGMRLALLLNDFFKKNEELAPAITRDALPDIDRAGLAKRVLEMKWNEIDEREVAFIADLLQPRKRDRHRPRSGDATAKRVGIVIAYLGMQTSHPDWLEKQVAHRVATAHKVSTRFVRRVVAEMREKEPERFGAIVRDIEFQLQWISRIAAEFGCSREKAMEIAVTELKWFLDNRMRPEGLARWIERQSKPRLVAQNE